MEEYNFIIRSFDPLDVEIPNVPYVEGKVNIKLPEVDVRLYDLSMGGLLPGACVTTKSRVVECSMVVERVKTGNIVDAILVMLPNLQEAHKIYQDEFDKVFLLDGKK
jgi:hypothetical protein